VSENDPVMLLDGVQVVDLTGEPAAAAGRILADLGATVTRVESPGGDALRAIDPLRSQVWHAGKHRIELAEDDPALAELLERADVVLDTPGWPGAPDLDPSRAPAATWVRITPFGLDGPRAHWRASDLGVMAASGNLFCTGDPDRAPLRCAEPTAYAHTAPEAAFAALTALASGRPQIVDLSMQETVLVANMGGPGRWFRDGDRGQRRGANIGRTREIWVCADGHVSFGVRGGKARVKTWETMTEVMTAEGIDTRALVGRDWAEFSHTRAPQEDLDAIGDALATYFGAHTMTELYDLACAHNLTLAPINSPREIYASAQLAAREFFGPLPGDDPPDHHAPRRFAHITVQSPAPRTGAVADRSHPSEHPAWEGVGIVEFGSGAAGPIATRYFVEHGATVVRVESRSRPDFLRVYALGPQNPHGLDGAPMFDALNVGKRSITIDLKKPEGRDLALRLVDWADAVAENFAPKAMAGLGLDYASLAERRPDLVMVSACLNGQTGPHRDYPGFGGQGAALAGFNALTGWPDREPVGPYGTITDSLAPRFVATALGAALLHRRRTGAGCHVDLSQVEVGAWSLSPWLARYAATGDVTPRQGNRSVRAVPHGVFPCAGLDRWVAVATWDDDEWAALAEVIGIDDPSLAELHQRAARVDEVEALVSAWTVDRDAADVTDVLQRRGLEAIPVQDFADVHDDPQLGHRGHFVALDHEHLGPGHYERNGFRLSDARGGYRAPSPLLGEHNVEVIEKILGLSPDDHARLRDAGVLD
jgi:crotonobetainyl-CoA:carnitine CoA-transferase CaiB-like acyl-CoA transferase